MLLLIIILQEMTVKLNLIHNQVIKKAKVPFISPDAQFIMDNQNRYLYKIY